MTPQIEIARIDPETGNDGQDIVDFVNTHFTTTEPLCEYLEDFKSKWNDVFVLETVQLGYSFKAIDTATNQMVGVILCIPKKRGLVTPMDVKLDTMEMDGKMEKISDLLDHAKPFVEAIVYEEMNEDHYMDVVILSVMADYGGQGIAKRLLDSAEEWGKRKGVNLFYMGCSSEYSAKVAVKCGYRLVYQLPYSKYLKDDQPVFVPDAPHEAFEAYIKALTPGSGAWGLIND